MTMVLLPLLLGCIAALPLAFLANKRPSVFVPEMRGDKDDIAGAYGRPAQLLMALLGGFVSLIAVSGTQTIWTAAAVAAFFLALILAAAIDLKHMLLPDRLTVPLIWGGLLINLNGGIVPLPDSVLGAVAGYVFPWLLHHAYRIATKRDGMGYGDFKLLAAAGAMLGLSSVATVALIACVSHAALGITRLRREVPTPFGPHLVAGTLVTFCIGPL